MKFEKEKHIFDLKHTLILLFALSFKNVYNRFPFNIYYLKSLNILKFYIILNTHICGRYVVENVY